MAHHVHISSASISSDNNALRTHFGKEEVPQIIHSGNVKLNGTTVEKVEAQNIRATDATVRELIARESIIAIESLIDRARGSSITANKCSKLGVVKSTGTVDLDECAQIQSVTGQDVTLRSSKVEGTVFAERSADITESIIDGTLTCTFNHLIIEASTIHTIVLRCLSTPISSSHGNVNLQNVASTVICGPGANFGNVYGIKVNSRRLEDSKETSVKKDLVLELRNSTVKNVIFEENRDNGKVILHNSPEPESIVGGKVASSLS